MADQIKVISITQEKSWQSVLKINHDPNFVDYWSWMKLVHDIYNIPFYCYSAFKEKQPLGYLSLSYCRHPFFGRYLATAPFDNYGSLYYENNIVRDELLLAAEKLAVQLKTDYLVVRHTRSSERPPHGWQQDPIYATYINSIEGTPEYFWNEHLKAKQRNQVKKSMTHGLECQTGGIELIDDFNFVLRRSMHDLGSPWHVKNFFGELAKQSGLNTVFFIIRLPDGKPIAASLVIHWLNRAVIYHANTINRYNYLYPGDFLYWSMIKHCYDREISSLDFGRSIMRSGNEHFKMKWNPAKQELAYWYKLINKNKLPSLNQKNPKFSLAIMIWKMIPMIFLDKISKFMMSGLI